MVCVIVFVCTEWWVSLCLCVLNGGCHCVCVCVLNGGCHCVCLCVLNGGCHCVCVY